MDKSVIRRGHFSGRFHRNIPILLGLLALLVCAAGALAQADAPQDEASGLTAEQVQLNLDSFDKVWSTIRDRHWDPELGGLDWEAIRDELRPQVAEATSMARARAVMNDLISRLEQSHFAVFPGDAYEDAAAGAEGAPLEGGAAEDEEGEGVTGLDLRVRNDQAVVVGVLPESPAELAGVRPGWVVLNIDGTDLGERIAQLKEKLPDNTSQRYYLAGAMSGRLTGDVGDTIPVTFLDGDDREVELALELAARRGVKTTFGNMPPVKIWHETRTLDGDVGYFRFNMFLGVPRIMPAFNQAMAGFKDKKGVIIDLRGNPGGIGAMAMGMSSWFVKDKGQRLGVMTMRNGEFKFVINPRPDAFAGPVALLIDEKSASTSEIMAGGLKDLGRARLFGTLTAGAALPSYIEKLPNGDGFQYAVANYVSEGGYELEGNGVQPDVEILAGRDEFLAQTDPVLAAARQWILSQ